MHSNAHMLVQSALQQLFLQVYAVTVLGLIRVKTYFIMLVPTCTVSVTLCCRAFACNITTVTAVKLAVSCLMCMKHCCVAKVVQGT